MRGGVVVQMLDTVVSRYVLVCSMLHWVRVSRGADQEHAIGDAQTAYGGIMLRFIL